MVRSLRFLFGSILVFMLAVTSWASLDKSVIEGIVLVLKEPWAAATLADAYCGFITFYAWVFYKEPSWAARIAWFVAIMILGNIGMAFYVLWNLRHLGANARAEDILLRRTA
jgi:hypothetical protein